MPTMGQRLRDIIGDALGADIVELELEKAIKDAKESISAPVSSFYDPLSLFHGREWLVQTGRPLSPHDLRRMSENPIVGSIIQTRMNQVAMFCVPQPNEYSEGFKIVTDEGEEAEAGVAKEIQDFMTGSGIPGYGEDTLENLCRKMVRDSLTMDLTAVEVVPRRNGMPAYMVGVDAATIKRLKTSLNFYEPPANVPFYVQVINEVIVAEYTHDRLIFGVRNPRTELGVLGYGFSELEMLVRVVTTIVNAEKYNSAQLGQGGTSKGILVVKADANEQQMENFKKDFRMALRSAADTWRPPVLQVSEQGSVDWVQLDRANRDMEYAQLFDFLVKQACAVYSIAPEEINWQIGASGVKTQFESSRGDKSKDSQKRGLQPLLRFLENNFNTHVVSKIDPRYRMEFYGITADRDRNSAIRLREVQTVKTLNELRAELNLPALDGGDIVLNEEYLKGIELRQMAEFGEVDLNKEPSMGN